MKYMVYKSIIQVVGTLWMGGHGSCEYDLRSYDVENIKALGDITRDTVEAWLDTNAGDFQHVTDFRASIEDDNVSYDIPWSNEESEYLYYGEEE
jgi:hypothetical protein